MARTKVSKKKSDTKNTDDRENINQHTENTDQPIPGSESKESTAAKMNADRLSDDEEYITLPETKDIPGQENITSAGVPGAMADTTASSADEEGMRQGRDVLSEDEDEPDIVMGTEADVTEDDLLLLGDPDKDPDLGEDELIPSEGLDDTDEEGDPLNEAAVDVHSTGEDLDIPDDDSHRRSSSDPDDEENDYYSLGGDRKDDDDDGTPEEYRDRE